MSSIDAKADRSYFDSARDALHASYIAELRRGGFPFQRCAGCETRFFPPVVRCGACGSSDLTWSTVREGIVVAAIRAGGSEAGSVVIDVGGCRVLAKVDNPETVHPGALVQRIDVRDDDRTPRVDLVVSGIVQTSMGTTEGDTA